MILIQNIIIIIIIVFLLCALADLIPIYLLRERVIIYDQRPLSMRLLTLGI